MQHNVPWVEPYLHTKWHLDPSSCLGTIGMGRKFEGGGVLPPFWERGAGSPSNTMSLGSRRTFLPRWHLEPSTSYLVGPKIGGGCCAPLGGGPGSQSNTVARAEAYRMPSFILIRLTVWPQCTNVTDRTGQTDRQRSDSIGRTVLQTVAQKSVNVTYGHTRQFVYDIVWVHGNSKD